MASCTLTRAGALPWIPNSYQWSLTGSLMQRRPITGADPLPPRTNPPLEISAPQQPPTADQDKGVFSALKRIPDLMRPDPPAPIGETPRPPMPVGPASPEIK